ncbi:uncharacterized protein LOC143041567 [Oratosquilla oratoria]|uniref:uncharacterized protein LOC143041567 n=1 Tax=Oratosquilla oratoria TaxID=337810 RepID=UPI003F76CA1E
MIGGEDRFVGDYAADKQPHINECDKRRKPKLTLPQPSNMDFKTHLIFLVWASFVIGALAQHQGESNSSSANYYQLTSGQLPQFCPGSYSDQGTAVMQTCLRIQIVQSRITFFRGKYTQAHYCGSWEDTVKLNIASCGRNISDSSVPSCKAPCQNFEHALLYIYHKLRFFALILEDVILDQFMGPFFHCAVVAEVVIRQFEAELLKTTPPSLRLWDGWHSESR